MISKRRTKRMKKQIFSRFLLLSSILLLAGCGSKTNTSNTTAAIESNVETTVDAETEGAVSDLPEAQYAHSVKSSDESEVIPIYFGEQVIDLNEGLPYFTEDQMTTQMFEIYSSLDSLGRCRRAFANVCWETMPKEKRGEIGNVRPSGWDYNGKSNNNKYEWVDGNYVINRCHLLAYELTGENANQENLITGTRSMNLEMLVYENKVAKYVKDTGNHVLYRVTPIFYEDEPMAQGVEMEGLSVEDEGADIKFHVFVYNVEPGVVFNYETGENWAADGSVDPVRNGYESALGTYTDKNGNVIASADVTPDTNTQTYILNIGNSKIHLPSCQYASQISEKNRKEITATLEDLLADEYSKCGVCLGK